MKSFLRLIGIFHVLIITFSLLVLLPATVIAQNAVIFRDDFNGTMQDGWTWIRENPSNWSLTETALHIDLEYGDLWADWTNNCRNLLIRPAPDVGTYEIETSINANLVAPINQAHILLYSNDDDYVRFGISLSHSYIVYRTAVHEVNGNEIGHPMASYGSQSIYLRVRVNGSSAILYYSADGINWSLHAEISDLQFVPAYVGLVAFDGSEPASSSVADFDYFQIGTTPRVLFREADNGSWPWEMGSVPYGWDHVGIHLNGDVVYESHPGYPAGQYWDPIQGDWKQIGDSCGVFGQHSAGSFQHDSRDQNSTATNSYAEIPGDDAEQMTEYVESVVGIPFLDITCNDPFVTIACWVDAGAVEKQKGYIPGYLQDGCGGSETIGIGFTCVGLVERAAEEAGYNGGLGFIPPQREQIYISGIGWVPLLSPQLLYSQMETSGKGSKSPTDLSNNWLAGIILNQVDFILYDPEGRRLGHSEEFGYLNEIPMATYSGNGEMEFFIIEDAMLGEYRVSLVGQDSLVEIAIGGLTPGEFYSNYLASGQADEIFISVTISGIPQPPAPSRVLLFPNFPNPFNPSTMITFDIPEQAVVSLRVFDLSGRSIRTLLDQEIIAQGRYEEVWNGGDDSGRQVASGEYFYRLEVGNYSETKRMTLIK